MFGLFLISKFFFILKGIYYLFFNWNPNILKNNGYFNHAFFKKITLIKIVQPIIFLFYVTQFDKWTKISNFKTEKFYIRCSYHSK